MSSSVYSSAPLARLVREKLTDERLNKLTAMWPETRVVVLSTEFANGRPAAYSNEPASNPERFRAGILASASSPLTTPPVYILSEPFLDGGVSAIAPFQAFFDLAAKPPAVPLTHIVVISPYGAYPSPDSNPAQRKPFPPKPNFGEISARTGALVSESSVTKEIALAWSALSLRNAGISQEKVKERTGLDIAQSSIDLMLFTPDTRLGWDSLRFDPVELEEMFTRGRQARPRHLLP